LTPPASPLLRPAEKPGIAITSEQALRASRSISIPSLVSQTLGPDAGQQPSQEYLKQWHRNAVEDIHGLNAVYESTRVPKRQLETATHADSSEPSTDTSTAKRQRKSRFATLSNEVEGALSVLYRELESVTSLKLQIEELQSQKRQDAQLIKLRDNDIAIMRRDLDQRRGAVLELAQLRASMSHSGDLKREVEELRTRNAVLGKQLEESRAQTAAAREMVNTWKGKLSQLLDT
jgi:hypothetical protein